MAVRRYICTNQPNVNTRPFSKNISDFKISGDTDSTVAIVNSLTITHYHTATGGKNVNWTCWVTITFNDNTTITSDSVTHHTGEDPNYCPAWVNTFSNVSASKIQNSGIKSILIEATPNSGDKSLYWRATSTYPITIALNFDSYSPDPPTITYAGFSAIATIYDISSLNFTHSESFDSESPSTNNIRTLRIFNSSGFDVWCNIPSTSPTQLKPLNAYGTFNWTYTISDSFGQSVSTNGTLVVSKYIAPTINYFTAQRNSYDKTTIDLTVKATYGSSLLTHVTIKRWAEGTSTKYTVLDQSLLYYSTYTNDNISATGLSSGRRYYFELIVSDEVSSVTERLTVNGTSALLSVEKVGVGIGKLAARGTATIPNFEVAMPSFFTELATFSDIQYSPRSTTTITITKSQFAHWSSWAQAGPLTVTRIGPYVYLYGGIIAISDVPYEVDGNYYIGQIATLTSAYRPQKMISITQLVNESDICIRADIQTDGAIILRSNKASGPFPNGKGVILTGSWIAASSFSN